MTHPERYFEVETWYQSPEGNESVALIVLNGVGDRVVNSRSITVYNVISGTGMFTVGGDEHPVKKDSLVIVYPGVHYQDSGDLVMLATSTPAFDQRDVQIINEV